MAKHIPFAKLSKFGQELRKLRLMNSMNQKELAKHIKCSSSHICVVEQGKGYLTNMQLDLLMKLLNVPTELVKKLKIIAPIDDGKLTKEDKKEFMELYKTMRHASESDRSKIQSILDKYR